MDLFTTRKDFVKLFSGECTSIGNDPEANNQKKWDDEHPNEVEEDDEEETDTL